MWPKRKKDVFGNNFFFPLLYKRAFVGYTGDDVMDYKEKNFLFLQNRRL